MHHPNPDDCIVAVSSAWAPAPTGIIRLCGRDSFRIVAGIIAEPVAAESAAPRAVRTALRVFGEATIPADIYVFPPAKSYSGTETVEIHTIGSLPVLRWVSQALIQRGARPAVAGEFTSRAFLNGRLSASQVGAVLTLIHAENDYVARQSARTLGNREVFSTRIADRLAGILALIEAGIDGVEE
ncbi:MAG: hypothetical protein AB7N71_09120, partial [Phycisphaerae bacterium]